MMRTAAARSRPLISAARCNGRVISHPRITSTSVRNYANDGRPDPTILPGSSSLNTPGVVPAPPRLVPSPSTPTATSTLPAQNIPKPPPPPPVVTETAVPSTPPPPPPAPKRKRRRGRFLLSLILLAALGYAGGTYYALVSDNFHDFFTEYVPFGEEAVLFFEEREFKRRFPDGRPQSNLYPQTSGENKVTLSGRSGVTAKPSTSNAAGSSASSTASKAADKAKGAVEATKEKANTAATKVADAVKPKTIATTSSPAPATASAAAASSVKPVDNINIANAADPVVQEVSKLLNDLITVVNADNAGSKYASAIEKAKDSVKQIAATIATSRDLAAKAADDQHRSDQTEFDTRAEELVRRIQREQQEQELKFREEWEAEREKLARSYQERLDAESEAARKIADQRLRNELLEQATKLQDSFSKSIRDRVESERSGRLSKLNDLSSSVSELEKLTSEWTSTLNSNLKTQHLVVAVDAVRSIMEDPEISRPFLHELAVLKDIADEDKVVDAAIGSIRPSAYQRGLPTSAQLIDRFRRVAYEVRKASLLPEDAGAASHAASFFLSKVMFQKQGVATGDDVESVLTRTETLLEEGNLDEAAREMNSLQGWAKVLSRDWLAQTRTVLEARQALDVISTQAKLQSLLVE